MATSRRIPKINSLLKEVITEVVRLEVRNPKVPALVSISSVEVTRDLGYAKVFVSIIGTPKEQQTALRALQSAAGFISSSASKKVSLRTFPKLLFRLDETVEKQMNIERVLDKIHSQDNDPNTDTPPE